MCESNDKLKLIEEYASLFLTVDQIAILLDVSAEELRREIRIGTSPEAKAYRRGQLETTVELRRQTKMFAEKGSPQAEESMTEFGRQQKASEKG